MVAKKRIAQSCVVGQSFFIIYMVLLKSLDSLVELVVVVVADSQQPSLEAQTAHKHIHHKERAALDAEVEVALGLEIVDGAAIEIAILEAVALLVLAVPVREVVAIETYHICRTVIMLNSVQIILDQSPISGEIATFELDAVKLPLASDKGEAAYQ